MDEIFLKQCFQMPKFIFAKKYKSLRANAKILYMILYSSLLEALKKADDKDGSVPFRDRGGVYIVVSIELIADFFGFTTATVLQLLSVLELSGLIERKFIEVGKVKIYFNL